MRRFRCCIVVIPAAGQCRGHRVRDSMCHDMSGRSESVGHRIFAIMSLYVPRERKLAAGCPCEPIQNPYQSVRAYVYIYTHTMACRAICNAHTCQYVIRVRSQAILLSYMQHVSVCLRERIQKSTLRFIHNMTCHAICNLYMSMFATAGDSRSNTGWLLQTAQRRRMLAPLNLCGQPTAARWL